MVVLPVLNQDMYSDPQKIPLGCSPSHPHLLYQFIQNSSKPYSRSQNEYEPLFEEFCFREKPDKNSEIPGTFLVLHNS